MSFSAPPAPALPTLPAAPAAPVGSDTELSPRTEANGEALAANLPWRRAIC